MRRPGIIVRVVRDKGFGFLRDAQGDAVEYFFHRSAAACDWDRIADGAAVTFVPSAGPKGPRAEDVQLVATA